MENKLRFGTILNAYGHLCKLISGSDLEKNIDEDFHIYFICSALKSYFLQDSVVLFNYGLQCKIKTKNEGIIEIYVKLPEFENGIITQYTFRFSNDMSRIIIQYFKDFKKMPDLVLSANLLVFYGDKSKKENNLNVLYIGQSQGKKVASTSCKRLINHKKYLEILRNLDKYGNDDDVFLFLLNFDFKGMYVTSPDTEIEKETFLNVIEPKTLLSFATSVNAVEAFLINYFKPPYNSDFTNNLFKITHNNKWSYFNDSPYVYVCLEMFFVEYSSTKEFSYPNFTFLTDHALYKTGVPGAIYFKKVGCSFIFDGYEKRD